MIAVFRALFFMLSFYIYRNLPDECLKLPMKYQNNWDMDKKDVDTKSFLINEEKSQKNLEETTLWTMTSLRQKDTSYTMIGIYLFASLFPFVYFKIILLKL